MYFGSTYVSYAQEVIFRNVDDQPLCWQKTFLVFTNGFKEFNKRLNNLFKS